MRLLPNIRYDTERYPEKVARRLRAVNIAAWFPAAVILFFALARLTDPARWPFGIVTALFAVAIAAVPLLHRFGLLAAPLALGARGRHARGSWPGARRRSRRARPCPDVLRRRCRSTR